MKHNINTSLAYRIFNISLIQLILLVFSVQIEAQELQIKIESNHKVYVPEGEGPFPVVIAIPGCSGVSLNGLETDAGRPGDEGDRLFRRHYSQMAKKLQDAGYLVLLIDYLTAEGVPNTCGWEIHPKRVGDYIKEAIQFVKTIPQANTLGINIIGWSHGGEGVLQWLAGIEEEPNGVQSVIAVYPGCSSCRPWNTSIPALILLGEADDIALPNICTDLIRSLPNQTNVQVKSFANARHGFDLTEGPEMLTVGNGFTIGRNSKAGTNAWNEIFKFLNEN